MSGYATQIHLPSLAGQDHCLRSLSAAHSFSGPKAQAEADALRHDATPAGGRA